MTAAWLARLDEQSPPAGSPPGWLSGEESQRWQRLKHAPRLDQFLRGRWLLRRLCAQCWGGEPGDWRLSGYGPPRPLAPRTGFWLSLSHSGPWALAGLSDEGPVGVDVEDGRRPRDYAKLARWAFAAPEAEAVEAAQNSVRRELFFRLWTAKEALFKAGQAPGLFQALGMRISAVGHCSFWSIASEGPSATLVAPAKSSPPRLYGLPGRLEPALHP